MNEPAPLLSIAVPQGTAAAKRYVLEIVFSEMLGVPFSTSVSPLAVYTISRGGKSIEFPDIALANVGGNAAGNLSVPSLPLKTWPVDWLGQFTPRQMQRLPILFGSPNVELTDDSVRCKVDLFGSIFFMLSRYEESVSTTTDAHGRFPGRASLAYRASFLERPIVDEYVELLRAMMSRLWPELEFARRRGSVAVTCDVDQPFDCTVSSGARFLKTLAGDMLKRRNARAALDRIRRLRLHRKGDHRMDPNYTFDWYMDSCERADLKARFFFISAHTAGRIDGCYKLGDPAVQRLIDKIAGRGHEIGVHGSYNSYRDSGQVARERSNMIAVCKELCLDTAVRGNRQHYLRWDALQTPDHLDSAGYEYDTSGGYADTPGFRFGTALPFPMWSWQKNTSLHIRQRPLVLMETTLLSPQYLGLGCSSEALELSLRLKRRALRFGGDFTFLWHNSNLISENERMLFKELIH